MNATINGRILELDLGQLLETIRPEQALYLIDALGVTGGVIEAVGQQITEGCTDMGSCGSRDGTAHSTPSGPLDSVIRKVAKFSDDIAREEIDRLEKALAENEKDNMALRVLLRESYGRSV